MNRVLPTLVAGVVATTLLAASPALAVTLTGTVNFTTGTDSARYGADNELASSKFTISQSDPTKPAITVTAQGWSATTSSLTTGPYTLSREYVGQYGGGLGVTNAVNDYNGDYGLHQADNAGATSGTRSMDFVLLTFNNAVNLTSLTRNSFGLPGGTNYATVYDNDFTYGYLNAAPVDNGSWSTLPTTLYSPTNTSVCGASSCLNNTQALTSTSAYSNRWLVAASFLSNYGGDGVVDGFKLASVNVKWEYTAPSSNPGGAVPEPATWAQMLLGFGIAGVAVRRRRRALAAA